MGLKTDKNWEGDTLIAGSSASSCLQFYPIPLIYVTSPFWQRTCPTLATAPSPSPSKAGASIMAPGGSTSTRPQRLQEGRARASAARTLRGGTCLGRRGRRRSPSRTGYR